MTYTKKWRVNDDSLSGTVMVGGVPVAEVGPGKRTITATDAEHARLLRESNRFNPVAESDPDHPEEAARPKPQRWPLSRPPTRRPALTTPLPRPAKARSNR